MAETSCGWWWIPPQEAAFGTGWRKFPASAAVSLLLMSFVAVVISHPFYIHVVWPAVLGGGLCFLLVKFYRGWYATKYTLLRRAHRAFLRQLRRSQPTPEATQRGASRAISLSPLVELHKAFQGFIQDRNMYYFCHNSVKPLTQLHKLSYAEVAGPHEVEYFVSHYWGTPFRDYISSTWKHAEAVVHSAGQPGLEITRTRYWICTLPRCPVLCVRPAPLCLFV